MCVYYYDYDGYHHYYMNIVGIIMIVMIISTINPPTRSTFGLLKFEAKRIRRREAIQKRRDSKAERFESEAIRKRKVWVGGIGR